MALEKLLIMVFFFLGLFTEPMIRYSFEGPLQRIKWRWVSLSTMVSPILLFIILSLQFTFYGVKNMMIWADIFTMPVVYMLGVGITAFGLSLYRKDFGPYAMFFLLTGSGLVFGLILSRALCVGWE